jgi:hypothetical protein
MLQLLHVCCKRLFQMFHLFFQTMLQVFLFGCCICFTHISQVFLSRDHMFCTSFSGVFANVSDACFICYLSSNACCKCLIWMFQNRSGYCTCCNMTHLPHPQVLRRRAYGKRMDGALRGYGRKKRNGKRGERRRRSSSGANVQQPRASIQMSGC